MALDFFINKTEKHLFSLESYKYNHLEEIFTNFKYRTGIYIDEYGDSRLNIGDQKLIIQLINEYVEKTDLNKNKLKTKTILEFSGLLSYFIENNYNLELFGD